MKKLMSLFMVLTMLACMLTGCVTTGGNNKAEDKAETIYEIADLTYHIMVMMTEMGISLDEVRAELASRHVVDKKIKQEKMK